MTCFGVWQNKVGVYVAVTGVAYDSSQNNQSILAVGSTIALFYKLYVSAANY